MTGAGFPRAGAPPWAVRGRDQPGRELALGVLLGCVASAVWLLWAGVLPHWRLEGPIVALVLLGFARPLPVQAGLLVPLCLTAAWMSVIPISWPFLAAGIAFFLSNLVARTEAVSHFDLAHAGFALVAMAAGGAVLVLQHGLLVTGGMLSGSVAFLAAVWAGWSAWCRLNAIVIRRGGSDDVPPALSRSLVP